MADEQVSNPFKIEFTKVEREGFPQHERQCFRVTFELSRLAQEFNVSVFVDEEDAVWDEVVRLAKHQLHQDFAQLAQQTADWELSPEEVAKLG